MVVAQLTLEELLLNRSILFAGFFVSDQPCSYFVDRGLIYCSVGPNQLQGQYLSLGLIVKADLALKFLFIKERAIIVKRTSVFYTSAYIITFAFCR